VLAGRRGLLEGSHALTETTISLSTLLLQESLSLSHAAAIALGALFAAAEGRCLLPPGDSAE
jgi:hypothetical protein